MALVTFALIISTFPCSATVSLADEGEAQAADSQAAAKVEAVQDATGNDAAGNDAAQTDAAQTATSDPAQPASDQPQATADAKPDLAQIAYEDDDLVATVTEATPGALPEGASLAVRELTPTSDAVQDGLKGSDEEANAAQADIDAYVDAVTKVADQAQADGKSVVSARAYDIQLLDAQGNEIEPQGQVKVSLSYKKKAELESAKPDSSNVEVAHVQDNGQVESVAAQIDSDGAGRIESADFHADSFSVYVIFDTNQTSTTEPTNMGTYGWIRFGGDVKKPDSLPATPGFDNAGWMRYLKINVYTLKEGANPAYTNSYTYQKSFEHLATWADSFTVESSQLGGTVKMTGFRKAGESAWQQYPGLETSYAANQFYQTWSPSGFSGDENELNIYLDTSGGGSTPQSSQGTRYIVRYYHADGSYDQEDGTLTQGQSFSFNQDNKDASGETYSGVSVTAGTKAASVNAGAGKGTISYDAGTRLVKVNVYYKTQVERQPGGAVNGKPQYDAEMQNGTKVYDTSRDGLHTDKTAAVHGNDGRTFDLTLESWNIGTNMANVGMVFDASGSMVWTSNTPEAITKSPDEWRSLIGEYSSYTVLSDDQVNKILDRAGTDNSKLNYNDYKYYIYDRKASVNEYVPIGYSDGTVSGTSFVMDGLPMAKPTNNGGAGWYYVNSGGYSDYAEQQPFTAKQYIGVGPYKDSGTTYNPAFNENDSWNELNSGRHQIQGVGSGTHANYFYIDNDGNLKTCYFYNNAFRISQVYQKADDASTKSEVLQDSVGKFASTLNALSPESQVSMVRFSRGEFSSAQLALLNWTNDTTKMTAAMNQSYGDTATAGGSATASLDDMTVYNYGFTGATHTYKGIEAFIEDMTGGQQSGYDPTPTNNAASKYLIIFTDGKDNSKKEQQSQAQAYIKALKDNGYTVMTVLMESAGMNDSEKADATSFLQGLASNKPNSNDKYFYSARYDNGEALVAAFQEMAQTIAEPLQGYTVTDYIDPRFDLLDPSGNVLTTLNKDGTFTEHTVKLSDGKKATLKYDSNKKMFYLEWTNQEIPTTTNGVTGEDKVSVWSSTITVRAKDDFLGGNDILTNGNEVGLNRVFDPKKPNNPQTQKDFPKTTANPKVLRLSLGNYEDTIFKGEDIDPGNLYDKIAATADNTNDPAGKWYLDYLARIGDKDNKDYVAQLKSGQEVEVPYYYLPEPDSVTSYAGGSKHQADKVGTLTYKWVADDTGGNNPSNAYQTYTTTTVNDVRYHLEVTYQPDAVDYGQGDQYANNGTPRTLTLTGQSGTDKLIRDPVGTEQTAQVTASGTAVIHAVDGRIKVEKKVNRAKLLDFLSRLGDNDEVTFSLALQRSYQGKTDSTRSLQVKLAKASADADVLTYAKVEAMTADANGDVTIASQWQTELPIGDYTLAETIQGTGFGSPTYQAVATNAITDDTSTTDYVEKAEFAAAFTQGDSSIVWHVGQVVSGVPSTYSYGNSDFSYKAVTDKVKQVDPKLAENGGKNYLNAQIGQAAVTNHPLPNLDILKRAAEDHDHVLSNVEFKLYQSDANWTEPNLVAIPMRTATTDDAGKASFNFLPEGYYLIYETRAATGYQAPAEPWRIRVSGGKVTSVAAPDDAGDYQVTIQPDENGAYPIDNAKAQNLPSTGGSGTGLIYLAGLALLGGYVLSSRHRRKGANGGEA